MITSRQREEIGAALHAFGSRSLRDAAVQLWKQLGYSSARTLKIESKEEFRERFDSERKLREDRASWGDWRDVAFLFQVTDQEVTSSVTGQLEFAGKGKFEGAAYESFIFLAIRLEDHPYNRTQLAAIVREVNKLFLAPAIVLFRHGEELTVASIHRRLHKREETRDVLGKVTLIKDIHFPDPHRAHVDILSELSLQELAARFGIQNFVAFHAAWQKTLSISELNKRFYQQIANWYFWAIKHVDFPRPPQFTDEDAYRQQSVIRLLTRLIFCWFLKEKGLLPNDLFLASRASLLLAGHPDLSKSRDSLYYKAILQNLFFATLNRAMDRDEPGSRRFTRNIKEDHLASHYHHQALLSDDAAFIRLLENVPFLNGGLFENLDHRIEQGNSPYTREVRIDGFTDDGAKQPKVPDFLFFGTPHGEDLSSDYGEDRYRSAPVRGLIEILHSFKFTVAENTPVEEEVALDPELLGRVFENLLAAYNPETGTTARKQTGSFYTPREIVDYMVDEVLLAYLQPALSGVRPTADVERELRTVFAYSEQPNPFSTAETRRLVEAIQSISLLDPACGSGAFPMGALLKLVHVLGRLDPKNKLWHEEQERAAKAITSPEARKEALAGIERAFARDDDDYGRKLYLIENCLYGVDIQPIAVQITKLRFFISLIVNQEPVETEQNRGILALPNLETKFVAANSLISVARSPGSAQLGLSLHIKEFDRLETELKDIRRRHVTARSWSEKKQLRSEDRRVSQKLGSLLHEQGGFSIESAEMLVKWDPYDQNASAPFFDAEWMFNMTGGFDVCIGNPPYLRVQGMQQTQPAFVPLYKKRFESATGSFDLYALFIERGYSLLKPTGRLAYIVPHKFFQAGFGESLRGLLTDRQALTQVVRFGAEQVFEEATTYTCLLFLSADRSQGFELIEVRTLERADEMFQALRNREIHQDHAFQRFPAPTTTQWDFSLGASNQVLKRLLQHTKTLGQITRKIFQGIPTGADKVFVLSVRRRGRQTLTCHSKQLDEEVEIERGLVKPFLMGKDVHRYEPIEAGNVVIFPYNIDGDRPRLLSPAELKRNYPLGWRYFLRNKQALESRENGRFADAWHCFSRPQNLTEFSAQKIMTPEIAFGCQMSIDDKGSFYHTTKVYSFVFNQHCKASARFMLGLLNSRVLWFFLRSTGYVLRGGYYTFKTEYLRPFPIAASTPEQQKPVESLVDYVLQLHKAASKTVEEASRLRMASAYFEQLIDALVYELYFPEEFTAPERSLHTLLSSESFPTPDATNAVMTFFDRLFNSEHPVRKALFFLDSCETVQIIESKARENHQD
jgi:adenine-specific DNA-methyltransferase